MAIAEPAEHEVGGLSAEGEHSLARIESRPQLSEGEPDGRRSCISQPICRNDDPLPRNAERRRQNAIHAAIGLMWKDVVARLASGVVRCRRAMQKQFKAGAPYRIEVVPEFGKPGAAAGAVGSAVRHCQARRAPTPDLAVKHVRQSSACALVVVR